MRVILIVALFALGACGGAPSKREPHQNQVPSNYEPGLHISGHVNVGVVRSF